MAPKVSILCVTHLEENQKYLDLCLKSINNLNYPVESLDVLVLSTGSYDPDSHGYRSVHTTQKMHFPEGVNFGVRLLEPSKYILVLNDDVIMTKDSLKNMVEAAMDGDCIVGPISNCDQGRIYSLPYIGYEKDGAFKPYSPRSYRYDEVAPIADKLMNAPHFNPGIWKQSWIAFYAVLFPRKIWDRVGTLDPKFRTGADDLDYCLRCKQANVAVLVAQNALVWHAAGATADISLDKETRDFNDKYFMEKWGISPYAFH